MTNHPQILDGTLTIADDGTTWILTASEIRALQAARERSDTAEIIGGLAFLIAFCAAMFLLMWALAPGGAL